MSATAARRCSEPAAASWKQSIKPVRETMHQKRTCASTKIETCDSFFGAEKYVKGEDVVRNFMVSWRSCRTS